MHIQALPVPSCCATRASRVQPFLRKIFEGINGLEFDAKGVVTAMRSEEGESVTFAKPFDPATAGGAVERWLIDCEAAMRDTLRAVVRQSFDAYASRERIKWVCEWPGQVVLCVDSMYWSHDVAAAIVVDKVRAQLSKLERRTLSALIVINVHARDVADELARQNVASENDFEWTSQLRYGWDSAREGVVVRMLNAALGYGYEYLGNGGRLVITPLTDRCYRTLMGALHLNLGGAPEGPAATALTTSRWCA
ncbi:Dynein heavy chain 7, axonemal [Monoraphidium neglectum]|uniref:Dynein heavy chain 7, axonemal n=1 Tax=Monoraphidium neglectum TaxID=145388 RepID=A0A0D2K8X9_9CHLO|nr:Dynein heavy chain 7, axonemal [Monoraphidium neglectum]KIY92558.1 Dynein heavy chain 7, axonemal [Monoraphidium neglectum]|eukprot:XP_013891578.1 Dynein heavy chain 7, axonemal [Monoraphidium neglectum]